MAFRLPGCHFTICPTQSTNSTYKTASTLKSPYMASMSSGYIYIGKYSYWPESGFQRDHNLKQIVLLYIRMSDCYVEALGLSTHHNSVVYGTLFSLDKCILIT